MKIPKDIRKKKIFENKDAFLKKEVIKAFKVEFRKAKKNFHDKRNVIFKRLGEKGRYSKKLLNKDYKIVEHNNYVCSFWDEDLIEVYLNYNVLDRSFFQDSNFSNHFTLIKNIFKYIALHEYGHTFSAKSTFNLLPFGSREVLKEIGVEDLRDVPDDKKEEIINRLNKTKYYKTIVKLINVDFGRLNKSFSEFYANYIVLTELDDSVPVDLINWKLNQLFTIISNIENERDNLIYSLKSDKYYKIIPKNIYFTLFNNFLNLTFEIFLFSEWNSLIEIFEQFNKIWLLYLLYHVNESFKEISNYFLNLDEIQDDLIKLAYILELIDYERLIFQNNLDEKVIQSLKVFIKEISEKNVNKDKKNS